MLVITVVVMVITVVVMVITVVVIVITVVVMVVYFGVIAYKSFRCFCSRLNVKRRFITCI